MGFEKLLLTICLLHRAALAINDMYYFNNNHQHHDHQLEEKKNADSSNVPGGVYSIPLSSDATFYWK